MSLVDLLLGKPLATSEERAEQIGPIAGIPVFGLDALSSAAYGPEAALTPLIPLGVAGIAHIAPISFAIIGLLIIVFFSYCQTIDAYLVVPLDRWTRISEKGVRFAMKISPHVQAVHVDAEDCSGEVCDRFERTVCVPSRAANLSPPELILLRPPSASS